MSEVIQTLLNNTPAIVGTSLSVLLIYACSGLLKWHGRRAAQTESDIRKHNILVKDATGKHVVQLPITNGTGPSMLTSSEGWLIDSSWKPGDVLRTTYNGKAYMGVIDQHCILTFFDLDLETYSEHSVR